MISSNANWSYFDTLDLSTFDGIHFDDTSVTVIGERFAEQLLATPSIGISSISDGEFLISFSGILYTSSGLESWSRVDPQPSSPYKVSSEVAQMFFQADRR